MSRHPNSLAAVETISTSRALRDGTTNRPPVVSEASAVQPTLASQVHVSGNFHRTAAQAICHAFGSGGTLLVLSAGYGGCFLGFFWSDRRRYIAVVPNLAPRTSFDAMFSRLAANREHDRSWSMAWQTGRGRRLHTTVRWT